MSNDHLEKNAIETLAHHKATLSHIHARNTDDIQDHEMYYLCQTKSVAVVITTVVFSRLID